MKIIYECDRKKPCCMTQNCNPDGCSHTEDINHARNFIKEPKDPWKTHRFREVMPGVLWEIIREEKN